MFGIRLAKYQNYQSFQRILKQLCLACLDCRRNIFLVILFVIIVPTFYLMTMSRFDQTSADEPHICAKLIDIIYNSNRTLCSVDADRRGKKQRIIALSVFGPKENPMFADSKFTGLITPFLDEAQSLFPTWTVRVYSDNATIHRLNLGNLSRLSSNVDVCNVNQLPIIGNVGEYLSGKLWRFLPALDPMVDFTSSRDLDSPLSERERVVVEEFVQSSHIFLAMRDHPLHGISILGGLWTAAQDRDRLLFLRIFSILLDRNRAQRYSLIKDQYLLNEIVWPKVKDRTLSYDSYTCLNFRVGDYRPFPTQRPESYCHLGCVRPCCLNSTKSSMPKPCPKQCRPKQHRDWKFC